MKYFSRVLTIIVLLMAMTACTTTTPSNDNASLLETTIPAENTETASGTADTSETRGQALFVKMIPEVGFACATCHHLTEARLIGPGLGDLATRLENYELDMSLEEYIEESIIHPQRYIVGDSPEYPANLMPRNYSELLTEEQIDELVAYILSL